MDNPKKLAT